MFDPFKTKAKVALYTGTAFLFGVGIASGLGWTDASMAMPVVDSEPQISEEAVRPALDLSDAFVNIANHVTPAVVRIEVQRPRRMAQHQVPEQFRRFFDSPDGQQDLPPATADPFGQFAAVPLVWGVFVNDNVIALSDINGGLYVLKR